MNRSKRDYHGNFCSVFCVTSFFVLRQAQFGNKNAGINTDRNCAFNLGIYTGGYLFRNGGDCLRNLPSYFKFNFSGINFSVNSIAVAGVIRYTFGRFSRKAEVAALLLAF